MPNQPPGLRLAQKRILVLGTALHTSAVDAYAWNDLPTFLNVADYDVVILNLVSFLEQQTHLGIRAERLPTWQQLARLLFSTGSEIVCIGLPGGDSNNNLYQSTTWWLPVMPEFVFQSGEVIRDVKPEFSYYFEHVQSWYFYANPSFKPHFMGLSGYLRVVHPFANNLQAGMGAIAYTRAKQPIGFKLIFRAGYGDRRRALPAKAGKSGMVESLMTSGVAIWLPPPTEISADEAVGLILQHRYGKSVVQAPPTWVETYQLPHQEAIAAQIAQQQQAIDRLKREIAVAQQQMDTVSSFNRLLYEQNQDALALVVSDTLRQLGGQVSAIMDDLDGTPAMRGLLRLIDPTDREAIVLVKSRAGTLPMKDLRRLDQYVRGIMLRENWHGKGILIANTDYNTAPTERAAAFPPNCIRAAQQLFSYCLLTTTQLYEAIASQQRGNLDATEFWNSIFEINGISPLPELTRPALPRSRSDAP